MAKSFIDIHTHLLPQTDDGTRSMKESLACFEKAIELGFQTIVLTPHYLSGVNYDYDTNLRIFRILSKKVRKKNIPVQLILASEVMLSDDIIDNLMNKKIATINQSQYLLVEMPMYNNGYDVKNTIYQLKEKKYIPVIAHPERCDYFQNDLTKIDNLLKMGVVFQLNAASLFGLYGKTARETARYLLKHKKIHLIASDAHSINAYDSLEKTIKYVTKLYGEKTCELLFSINPQAIINNKEVVKMK